ncbi:cell division protein SepF [Oceanobacillus caeni]|uniref:Cell division protein SepF n=1 Tax=Oceanobacillus caeni TaxID=405946 RepID=A0ABR5MLY1_9BACI|nr:MULTISPECIES: cell division protein SepF [Bacillaceae]KKE78050.1 cell division protein SepF [Bacilli bacterium VT-13-104]PZD85706.1 cell division protein SepF [Bacilli bacterium]KPH77171.1 cell division protein SepF [Oceanobacillus caeni]MBU8790167.1 cell division protein SepF [Oceanobacillus caeni]MCR1835611.1 cell division protein SepF [Oceanobacillus caeni]
MSIKNKLKSFFVEEDYEYEYVDEEEIPENKFVEKQKKNQNVVSLAAIQQPNSKVILCEPRTYNEAQEIADNIVSKRAVVINLQRVDRNQAKRIVDFLSGTVYALNGDIQKLGSETFLCTPENIDVSGTITDTLINEDDYDKGW